MRSVCWRMGLCLGLCASVLPLVPAGASDVAPGPAVGPAIVATGTQPLPALPVASQPALPVPATQPSASPATPACRIETIEYDFGKVWAGETVNHTFELTNLSEHVLEIRGVTTACGCTTADKWDKQVQPGQVWNLDTKLSTTGTRGPIHKTITVKTDDPNRQEILFVLKGHARSRFDFSPAASVAFGAVQASTQAKHTLVITNNLEEPVIFGKATPSTPYVKVTLREIDKGHRYELDVETVPPLPESGSLGTILLETDLKEESVVRVPVYVLVRPRVYLSPKTITIPSTTATDIQRSVQVLTTDGKKPAVVHAEASDPGIEVIIDAASDDQPGRVKVRVPKGMNLQSKPQVITIHTDDPEFPTLTCDLKAFAYNRTSATRPAGSQPVVLPERMPGTATALTAQPTPSQSSQASRSR